MSPSLVNLWDRLRTNFWLIPSAFVVAALAAAVAVPWIGVELADASFELPAWLQTSSENARSTLAAIGTAMITVTATVFSVTIVALSLASQQFGPRLLRRFMNDLPTQFTLAVFLSTGFFCLFALRSIYGDDDDTSSADVAVALAELLAVVSAGMLIVYIHHIAVMIQASTIVTAVARDLDQSLASLFPEMLGRPEDPADGEEQIERAMAGAGDPVRFCSLEEGYVQAVDAELLVALSRELDLLLELRVRPGDFVAHGAPLGCVWARGADSALDADDLAQRVNAALIVGQRPTPRQDVEAAIAELVQVALRALSAGINDPLTAGQCVDRLGASLGRLAERDWPSRLRADSSGRLRLITRAFDFPGLLDAAFGPIRQYGRGQVVVVLKLLTNLATLVPRLRRPTDADAVRCHAEMLVRTADALPEARDAAEVRRHADRVFAMLEECAERATERARGAHASSARASR